MKIAMLHGQWAQNIGNAFFNLGGEYIFENAAPSASIFRIMDQPNYRTLHNKFKGNPDTFWDPIANIDTDLVVLQGPVLNAWFPLSWEKTIKALHARGAGYALHSCSFFKFTETEFTTVHHFLEKYPPLFISTRDSNAYEKIKSWGLDTPLIDGIDAGFFVNKAYTPPHLYEDEKVVTFNFDRYPEPNLSEDPHGLISISDRSYKLQSPRLLQKYSAQSKVRAYLGELFDNRQLPQKLGPYKIIRPEHRFFPHVTKKIYKRPAAYASDEPYTYLTNYANSVLTLSDRVHACVATLAYGGSAMLFTPSPRAGLFERIGASNIKREPTSITKSELEQQQDKHIEAIRAVLTT